MNLCLEKGYSVVLATSPPRKMNQQEARFIFDWRKSQWNYRLPVLPVGISLFGHIFCFYIFRVVYPTTTTLLPPSAQVTVLDPNNPQDKSLLDWVEMNNPANVSAPRFDPRLVAQLTPQYKPIYSSLSVELKPSDSPEAPREQGIPSIFSPERDASAGAVATNWMRFQQNFSQPIGYRFNSATARVPVFSTCVADYFHIFRANLNVHRC